MLSLENNCVSNRHDCEHLVIFAESSAVIMRVTQILQLGCCGARCVGSRGNSQVCSADPSAHLGSPSRCVKVSSSLPGALFLKSNPILYFVIVLISIQWLEVFLFGKMLRNLDSFKLL